MNVVHIVLVSSRGWDFIFLDKLWVHVAACAGAGEVERIDPGARISLSLNVVSTMTIMASGHFGLAFFLGYPMNASLITLAGIGMASGTANRRKSGFRLNLMSSMTARTRGEGSMNTPLQHPPGLLPMA